MAALVNPIINGKRQIITGIIASAGNNPIKVHKFSRKDSPNAQEPTFDGVIFFKNSLVEGKTHTQLYFEKDWTNDEIEIGEETIENNAYFDFRTVVEGENKEEKGKREENRGKEIALAANAISMISDLSRNPYYVTEPKLPYINSTTGQVNYGNVPIPNTTLGGSKNKTYRHIKGDRREQLKRKTISSRTKHLRKINQP
jgi:hypothetical protein